MKEELQNMRRDYTKNSLNEGDLTLDPITLFTEWFSIAKEQETEANACILSTIGLDGHPDARVILLKGIVDNKFEFYTNHQSSKGQQLEVNPACHLLFNWINSQKQVRIKGNVQKLTQEQAAEYYNKRPRGSRIGAWASPQSQPIDNRTFLEVAVEKYQTKFEGQEDIPIPPFWGGYRLIPEEIEFWQGRSSRLHDRFRYSSDDKSWTTQRLAP